MEYASFLAGERWSDHPACTHPLLAALARMVNDAVSDQRRSRLARLVPDVVGLTSDDPRVDIHIALRAAATALPVASAERQRILAVALLTTEQIRRQIDGPSAPELTELTRHALDQVPATARWAREYTREERLTVTAFQRYVAPTTVRCAVEGIALACIPDPDQLLYTLLEDNIRTFPRRAQQTTTQSESVQVTA